VQPPILRGSETILLVEDDDLVRRLARQGLEKSGYQVVQAGNGEEALGLLAHHPGPIHLLLTDVVMPGISGREMAERVAEVHPEVKTLFMSGYTDDAILLHGVSTDQMAFLGNPFTPRLLAQRVREVLDTP
jgi:CheY-like chemotaxis protein